MNNKLSNYTYLGALILFTSLFFLLGVNFIQAQTTAPALTEYQLLEPLPFSSGTLTEKVTAVSYIPGLFRLMIAIAGVLAVIRLIYAGIMYMSTDAFSGKSEAKGIIEDALWGLLLAIGAWIIVATVLPTSGGVFNFNLTIPTTSLP